MKQYQKLIHIVENKLSCSIHNMDHVYRVYNTCLAIAEKEKSVNLDVLIPAVLLHDIARIEESKDKTGTIDHAELGSKMAREILENLKYDSDIIRKITHCISTHRFRSNNEPQTLEAKILFDADKLDAIGAIGLARSYMFAGQHGQQMHIDSSLEEYLEKNISNNGRLKVSDKHSPFIEYQVKFKKVPDKLYTKTAKRIAKERLHFMDIFFTRIEDEIAGKI